MMRSIEKLIGIIKKNRFSLAVMLMIVWGVIPLFIYVLMTLNIIYGNHIVITVWNIHEIDSFVLRTIFLLDVYNLHAIAGLLVTIIWVRIEPWSKYIVAIIAILGTTTSVHIATAINIWVSITYFLMSLFLSIALIGLSNVKFDTNGSIEEEKKLLSFDTNPNDGKGVFIRSVVCVVVSISSMMLIGRLEYNLELFYTWVIYINWVIFLLLGGYLSWINSRKYPDSWYIWSLFFALPLFLLLIIGNILVPPIIVPRVDLEGYIQNQLPQNLIFVLWEIILLTIIALVGYQSRRRIYKEQQ